MPQPRLLVLTITSALALAYGCQRGTQEKAARPDSVATPPPVADRLAPVDSGAPRLPPRDDADSSFNAFRERLLQALSAKDTTFLYSILTPDIKNSFGGDGGIEGFKRIWKPDAPSSEVWQALARLLRLGGKQINDNVFIAPYVHAFWPDSIDAFEYVAVTSEHARVYEEPKFEARIIGTTSYAIVHLIDWRSLGESGVGSASAWARIALPNGRQGWIKGDDVYSPVGWRAFFAKRDGRWRMSTFVAGD